MIPYAAAIKVVDRISEQSDAVGVWKPIMQQAFASACDRVEDDLTTHQFVAALGRAVHNGAWGFWLSPGQADRITTQASKIITTRVGSPPDADWSAYRYEGDSVDDGLSGFDRWLVDNAARYRLRQFRLVRVDTESDAELAVLHPANHLEDLITHLTEVGVAAKHLA